MQVISADVEYGEVLPLAETMGLSFYDASYLRLAFDLKFELVTLDKRLAAAAAKIGVRT
jgi:predicted nucleic acid-binding protein